MLHLNYTRMHTRNLHTYVHLLQEEQRGICDQLIDSPVGIRIHVHVCSVYAFVKHTRTLTIHTRMHTHIYIHTYIHMV